MPPPPDMTEKTLEKGKDCTTFIAQLQRAAANRQQKLNDGHEKSLFDARRTAFDAIYPGNQIPNRDLIEREADLPQVDPSTLCDTARYLKLRNHLYETSVRHAISHTGIVAKDSGDDIPPPLLATNPAELVRDAPACFSDDGQVQVTTNDSIVEEFSLLSRRAVPRSALERISKRIRDYCLKTKSPGARYHPCYAYDSAFSGDGTSSQRSVGVVNNKVVAPPTYKVDVPGYDDKLLTVLGIPVIPVINKVSSAPSGSKRAPAGQGGKYVGYTLAPYDHLERGSCNTVWYAHAQYLWYYIGWDVINIRDYVKLKATSESVKAQHRFSSTDACSNLLYIQEWFALMMNKSTVRGAPPLANQYWQAKTECRTAVGTLATSQVANYLRKQPHLKVQASLITQLIDGIDEIASTHPEIITYEQVKHLETIKQLSDLHQNARVQVSNSRRPFSSSLMFFSEEMTNASRSVKSFAEATQDSLSICEEDRSVISDRMDDSRSFAKEHNEYIDWYSKLFSCAKPDTRGPDEDILRLFSSSTVDSNNYDEIADKYVGAIRLLAALPLGRMPTLLADKVKERFTGHHYKQWGLDLNEINYTTPTLHRYVKRYVHSMEKREQADALAADLALATAAAKPLSPVPTDSGIGTTSQAGSSVCEEEKSLFAASSVRRSGDEAIKKTWQRLTKCFATGLSPYIAYSVEVSVDDADESLRAVTYQLWDYKLAYAIEGAAPESICASSDKLQLMTELMTYVCSECCLETERTPLVIQEKVTSSYFNLLTRPVNYVEGHCRLVPSIFVVTVDNPSLPPTGEETDTESSVLEDDMSSNKGITGNEGNVR